MTVKMIVSQLSNRMLLFYSSLLENPNCQSGRSNLRHSTFVLTFLLLLSAIIHMSCGQHPVKEGIAVNENSLVDSTANNQPLKTDKEKLRGIWVRTDTPYQINITGLSGNGTLEAAYLNPSPVHIGSALWADADGILKVYIELRDKNYPGSNYKLSYNPQTDMLEGEYYQAAQGATYQVAFARLK